MTWRAANRPVLVTGFEPFDGDTVNPSWEVARALHGKTLGGARIEAVRLPCSFGTSLQVLGAALAPRRPAVVVALGQAGRAAISLERVALNVDDARIPIDTNLVERGMRPVAVGRKNHYGSKSERGTRVAALFYTLIESAKLAGVEPGDFLAEATRRAINNPGTVTLPRDLAPA